jgi:Holliday junction resolvase RusA-like endonuclease
MAGFEIFAVDSLIVVKYSRKKIIVMENENKILTVYQNPDFDDVFFFYDEEIFTSSEKFKHVEGKIYERTNKENAINFIKKIKEKLRRNVKTTWPYKDKLMVVIGASGSKSIYGNRDLDNIVKPVFDAFKGIVFEDDSQVHLLIASKQIWENNLKGFMVGIRILDEKYIDKYVPWLYTTNPTEEFMIEWNKKFKKEVAQ